MALIHDISSGVCLNPKNFKGLNRPFSTFKVYSLHVKICGRVGS